MKLSNIGCFVVYSMSNEDILSRKLPMVGSSGGNESRWTKRCVVAFSLVVISLICSNNN